jgi:hypothetical protein
MAQVLRLVVFGDTLMEEIVLICLLLSVTRFNSRFLVTNNSRGMSIWNFKEAVSTSLHETPLYCSFQVGKLNQRVRETRKYELFPRFLHTVFKIAKMFCILPNSRQGTSWNVRVQRRQLPECFKA